MRIGNGFVLIAGRKFETILYIRRNEEEPQNFVDKDVERKGDLCQRT